MRVAVIGAGAFGGWAAYHLLRAGAEVTLIDAWGPGHSRASSGGETRIIRTVYGEDLLSVRFSARSLELWKEYERRWSTRLLHRTGAIFLGHPNDEFLRTSHAVLREHGVETEELSKAEATRRYPQMNFEDIGLVLLEPEAGYLTARENCRTVAKQFIREGGRFELASARMVDAHTVRLSNGGSVQADSLVFACGPWMATVFPDLLAKVILPTRQEVVFLATPPGDDRFSGLHMPCWGDRTSESMFYGIPDVEHRGFKIASDIRGPAFDPSSGDRRLDPQTWPKIQQYVRHRFPALADSVLIETRVCPYENTPDLGLLVDRHPEAANVLLVGGGSGHGYKQGPAIGEYAAKLVLGNAAIEPALALARFQQTTKQLRSSF